MLSFSSRMPQINEFDWVENFNWSRDKEPNSRWKAVDSEGFAIWLERPISSSGNGTELGAPKIRDEEIFMAEADSELKQLNNFDESKAGDA